MPDLRILPRTTMRGASSQVSVWTETGFPFDFAQGGEPVEPRVKPGMTRGTIDYINTGR
jgi:hypothetical protein